MTILVFLLIVSGLLLLRSLPGLLLRFVLALPRAPFIRAMRVVRGSKVNVVLFSKGKTGPSGGGSLPASRPA